MALITGGGSGIGLATARRLFDNDWKVALVDRDASALEHARAAFDGSDRIFTAPLDVTDEPAVSALVAKLVEVFGGLDGVVNSAGIAADVHALETPIDLFRKMMDINVVGTFIVARAAARVMKDNGSGAIVNLASIAGLRGSKGRSAYGASKGAVCVLTQVLANDLARYGIRVNAVAPGPVETPMIKALHTDADRSLYANFIPMQRYGAPDEIASVIAFLLDGTSASYVTGEIVAVDGGFRGTGVMLKNGAY